MPKKPTPPPIPEHPYLAKLRDRDVQAGLIRKVPRMAADWARSAPPDAAVWSLTIGSPSVWSRVVEVPVARHGEQHLHAGEVDVDGLAGRMANALDAFFADLG